MTAVPASTRPSSPRSRRCFLASLPFFGLAPSCSSPGASRAPVHPVALFQENGQPAPLQDAARGSPPNALSAAIDQETLVAVPVAVSQKIFDAYRVHGISLWNLAWRDVDFTGICWSSTRSGTVVGPRHVVCASHYPKNPGGAAYRSGSTLTFTDPSGRAVTRTVVAAARAATDPQGPSPTSPDVSCILLDSDLPPSIRRYRVLPFTDPSALHGTHAIRTSYWGFKASLIRIHRNTSPGIQQTFAFYRDPAEPAWIGPKLKVGDSGNPVLVMAGGYPCLVATHSSPSAGPCFLHPLVLDAVQHTFQSL